MDLVPYLSDGTWPAARLYTLLYIREASRADYEERFHLVGEWAADVCADYLQGVRPFADLKDAEAIAVGFVCIDNLPCGKTIDSFWNRSPFDPLRLAPCDVSAKEDEVATWTVEAEQTRHMETTEATWTVEAERTRHTETTEAKEVIIEDEEATWTVEAERTRHTETTDEEPQGLDEQIEALTVSRLLTSDYVIPGWVIATCFGIVTVYAWTVAAALSMKKLC
jgi:hypothetical protein